MISLRKKLEEAEQLLSTETELSFLLEKVKAIPYDPLYVEKQRIQISIVSDRFADIKEDVSGCLLKEGYTAVKDAICQHLQDRINYCRSEREKIKIN